MTAFVPASRKRMMSLAASNSRPMLFEWYDTQSAFSATSSSQLLVAMIPVGARPMKLPASLPIFSGDWTYMPASSSSGWLSTPSRAARPTEPVPACTTLKGICAFLLRLAAVTPPPLNQWCRPAGG